MKRKVLYRIGTVVIAPYFGNDSRLKTILLSIGFEIVSRPDEADYIFLTTCAFKEKEENHSISRIEALKKYNKEFLIYGCLPDIAPSKYKKHATINHLAPKKLDQIDTYP